MPLGDTPIAHCSPSRNSETLVLMASGICPVAASRNCPAAARRSARSSVGQWRHPLSGVGLGEADAVTGGEHDVGAVQEPVDGGVCDGLGHHFLEPAGRTLPTCSRSPRETSPGPPEGDPVVVTGHSSRRSTSPRWTPTGIGSRASLGAFGPIRESAHAQLLGRYLVSLRASAHNVSHS